jgi:hypothetical protein
MHSCANKPQIGLETTVPSQKDENLTPNDQKIQADSRTVSKF